MISFDDALGFLSLLLTALMLIHFISANTFAIIGPPRYLSELRRFATRASMSMAHKLAAIRCQAICVIFADIYLIFTMARLFRIDVRRE